MSRTSVDLTGPLFDNVDFSESLLFFDPVSDLPKDLTFLVWGAVLLASEELQVVHASDSEDIAIAGLSELRFTGLTGGEIAISLYEDKEHRSFVETSSGNKVRISRSWPNRSSSAAIYEFMCALSWPPGYCHLMLAAEGSVTMRFDSASCIDLKRFLREPELFPPITPF